MTGGGVDGVGAVATQSSGGLGAGKTGRVRRVWGRAGRRHGAGRFRKRAAPFSPAKTTTAAKAGPRL